MISIFICCKYFCWANIIYLEDNGEKYDQLHFKMKLVVFLLACVASLDLFTKEEADSKFFQLHLIDF